MDILGAIAHDLRGRGLVLTDSETPNGPSIVVDGVWTVRLMVMDGNLVYSVPYNHADFQQIERVVERLELADPLTTPDHIYARVLFQSIPTPGHISPDKSMSGGMCYGFVR